MKHIDIRDIAANKDYLKKEVVVCGWVRTARDSKNMAFLEINDGTTLKHLQIVVDKAKFTNIDPETMKSGASVKVCGKAVESRQGGIEIEADEISLLGKMPCRLSSAEKTSYS